MKDVDDGMEIMVCIPFNGAAENVNPDNVTIVPTINPCVVEVVKTTLPAETTVVIAVVGVGAVSGTV